MRRLLSAIISAALVTQPMLADAASQPYFRLNTQGTPATGTTTGGSTTSTGGSAGTTTTGTQGGSTTGGSTTGGSAGAGTTKGASGTSGASGTTFTFVGPGQGSVLRSTLSMPQSALAGHVNEPFPEVAAQPAGGTPPYTYALTDGTLPAGLSVDARTGAITGVPTATGSSTVALVVTDAKGASATTAPFAVAVLDTFWLTAPKGIVTKEGSTAWSAKPTFANGIGKVTWAFQSVTQTASLGGAGRVRHAGLAPARPAGGLALLSDVGGVLSSLAGAFLPSPADAAGASAPAGMTVDPSTGVVTTNGVKQGSYTVVLAATDGTGTTATSNAMPVTVTSNLAALPPDDMTTHSNMSATTDAAQSSGGSGTVTWTIASGSLPSGMSLNASTGAITANHVAVGSYTYTLAATDQSGNVATTSGVTVTLKAPLSTSTPAGMTLHSDQTGSNGQPTVYDAAGTTSWAVAMGSLPAGLTLDAGTGALTANGVTPGSYTVTLAVADGTGETATTGGITFAVLAPMSTTTPAGIATHSNQSASTAAPTLSNAAGSATWALASGTLPSGIALNASNGVLSTVNPAAGTYTLTLRATDATGETATTGTVTITVSPAMTATAPSNMTTHSDQAASTVAPTVSNASGTVTWSVTSGILPAGATLSTASGVVAANHVAPGTYTYTLVATDSSGATATTGALNLTVLAPVNVTTPPGLTAHSNKTSTTTAPTVSNAYGATTWTLATGTLPAGMSLNGSTGSLTATTVAQGTYTFALTATDADSESATTGPLTVTVVGPLSATAPASITTTSAQTASTAAPTATNAIGTVTWGISTGLPTGMTLDPSTGIVTANHVAAGSYLYALTATDASGTSYTTGNFSITVTSGLTATAPPNLGAHSDQVAATQAPVASGFSGPVTWSVASGTLPTGMSFNASTGVITATRVAAGSYAFSLKAVDPAGETASTSTYTIAILAPLTAGAPANLTTSSTSTASTATPSTGNAVGATSWAIGSGTLPAGMALNSSTGVITATNATPGTYPFTLVATDASGETATSPSFTVTVLGTMTATAPANLSTHSNQGATTAAPTATNASGGVTWTLASGTLPSGMSLNASTGAITAFAVSAGTYAYTLKATDKTGNTATTGSFTVTVSPPLAVTTPPTFTTHSNVTASTTPPTVTNAVGAVAWSTSTTTTGTSLNASTGAVTVSGAAVGSSYYTITATDGTGETSTTGAFIIKVLAAMVATAPASLSTHANQTASTAAPTVTNASGTVTWSIASGSLPTGMALNAATGVLTATNVAAGTYPFTLLAADTAYGMATTGSFTVTVSPALSASPPPNLATHSNLTASTAAPTTANATGAVTWSLASGTLPPGMALNASTGVITATNVASGSYSYALKATDAGGSTATTAAFTVAVSPAMTASAPPNLSTHANLTASTAAPGTTNAAGAVTWSVASGSIPAGMSFNGATGVLTAANVPAGSYAFTLAAVDAAGGSATTPSFTILVAPALSATAQPSITTHANLTASTAAPSTTNAIGTVTWTLASGNLPTGMSLSSSTGVLTAANVAAGSYGYTLTATDSAGGTATTGGFTVTVVAALTATAPANLATHANQTASTAAPATTGASGTVTWTLASGTLPTGMTLDASTGVVTAANVAVGSYALTLTATDGTGATAATGQFTIAVSPALAVTTPADLTTHSNLTASTTAPAATNAIGPMAWTTAAALPSGLSLNGATGVVTATNAAVGNTPVTLTATDGAGGTATTGTFAIKVFPALSATAAPDLTTHSNRTASTGAPTASNAYGAVTWSIAAGSLPAGMSLNPATGVLTAANVAPGTYAYRLGAADAAGGTATTGTITVSVLPALAVTTPPGITTHTDLTASTAAPTASGNSGAVTWSVASGTLPAGMALDATTGIVTASGAAPGSYPFTLTATDGTGATATTGPFTVTEVAAMSVTTPPNLATHSNLTASTTAPATSNASGAVAWAIASGTLPAGMTLNGSTGVLTATKVAAGSYPFTLSATDAAGDAATTGTFTVTVTTALAATAPPNLATHANLTASTAAPAVSGNSGAVAWSLSSGTMPSGMALNASTGVITAASVATGSYTYSLTASDPAGGSATTAPFTITVAPALAVTTPPDMTTHSNLTASTAAPTTTNAIGATTWAITSGIVPAGMTLNTSTGVITAGDVAAGHYLYKLTGTDSAGGSATTGEFLVTVVAAMTVTTPANLTTHSNLTASTAAPSTSNASGAPTWSVASGTLPTGMSFSASTGVLTANAVAAGTYAYTLTGTDAAGGSATTAQFSITVILTLTATAQPGISAHSNQTASTTAPTAANASGAATWSIATGATPAGMTLDAATGILTATDVAPGSYAFTLTATDSSGATATTAPITIAIKAPLAVSAQPDLATHSNLTASTATPTTTNAIGTMAWTLASGTLPTGMTLSGPTGAITATNVAPGAYPFTLTGTDSTGASATTATVTVNVASAMAATAPANLTTHANQTASTAVPGISGNSGTVTWAIASGALPTGMTFAPSTGVLTATNVATGTYGYTLSATDAAGGSAATATFNVTVVPALSVTTPANLATHSDLVASATAPTTANAIGTVTWSVASGTLPTGMALNASSGVITASDVAPGNYAYALTAADSAGGIATTGSFSIVVTAPLTATAAAGLATHSNLTASTAAPTTTNAVGAVTWAIATGTLPTGMAIAPATGIITAAKVAAGTYVYTLTATDAAGDTATTNSITVTVTATFTAAAPPSLSTHSNLTASTASPSTSNANGAVTWAIASGALPTGMAFSPATGVLTATNVGSGSYAYTLTATDAAGATATTGGFSVQVSPALTATTPANLATHSNLTASTAAPTAANAVGTVTWTLASGALPTGMSLASVTGVLTATNVAAGTYPLSLAATDQANGTATTGSFTVTVAAPLAVTTPVNLATHSNLTASTAAPATSNAIGAIAWSVASGTLPPGMTLSSATGVLTARNVAAGTYALTLGAMDTAGGSATTNTFTITVTEAMSATAQPNLATHSNLTASTAAPTTSYASGAVTWGIASGLLPTGMALDVSTGILTANDVASGSYPYTLTATDSAGASATTGTFAIQVSPALSVSTPQNLATHSNLTASTAAPTLTNGIGTATWAIATGALPTGMTFSPASGILTATDVAPGTYPYTLTAADAAGGTATTGSFSVIVGSALTTSTPGNLSTHANLTASTTAPIASNASGAVTWAIASGTSPSGMAFSTVTGVLTATNVAAGSYPFTLTGTDPAGATATTGSFTILVAPAMSATKPANVATHSNLTASTAAPTTSNAVGAVTWAIASGTLPTGMTLNAATGALTATNVAPGTYAYTLTAADAAGGSATTGSFTVTVSPTLGVGTPANLATHSNLTASTVAPATANAVGAVTWTVASGALPTGMALNASTGILTATNVAAGSYPYTLGATDAAGGTATTGTFTVSVSAALSVSTPSNLSTHANLTASTGAPTVTGNSGVVTWSVTSGSLPTGMSFSTTTGALTATNVAAGTYAYVVTATDGAGGTASTGSFTVAVAAPLATTTPSDLATHTNLTASTTAPTTSNAIGAVTWSIASGTSSAGMTLNASTGVLTIAGAAPGSYPLTLTVVDAAGGMTTTGTFTVTVSAAMAVSTPAGVSTHSNQTASTTAPVVMSASGPVTWTLASGTPPSGMGLAAATGVLTATNVASGTYRYVLTANDATGASASTNQFTITVAPALSATAQANLATHADQTASTASPIASNAIGAVTWSLTSGTLPTGMAFSATSGAITSTNVAAGTYAYTATATDAANATATTGTFTVTVSPALAAIAPANLSTHSNLTASTAAPTTVHAIGTVSWAIATGTLPTGMTFAPSTGVLTATNVPAGTYPYTLTATDAAGDAATTSSFTVTVSPVLSATAPANLSTHSNLTASIGAPTIANNTGPVTWAIASGTLPTGMSFGPATGVLTATNVATGTYAYALSATDPAGGTATTGSFTVIVTAPISASAPANLATHANLTASTAAPTTANAIGAVAWTIASGTLPTGMSLNASTGAMTSANVAAGSYPYALTATDAAGGTATTGTFSIVVTAPLTATAPADLSTHSNLTASTTAPTTANAIGAVTWSIATGTLPTGMSLAPATGIVTASNVAAGSYPFTLTAIDAAGGAATTGTLTVTVTPAMSATAPANLATHANLTAATAPPTVSSNSGPVTWAIATGTLPTGMAFAPATGVLTATNVAAGSYAYTLKATDAAGGTAITGSFSVQVSPALSTTTPANLATHSNLTASTAAPTASNALGIVTWSVATGTLPTGMALNASTGVLTATNVAAGTYTFTLTATDGAGGSATTGPIAIAVSPALAATAPTNLATHSNLTASTAAPTTGNAVGTVTWSIATGTLPTGLTLAASTGVLTATNVAAGSYTYTLTASDAAGGSATTGSFNVTVTAAMSATAPANLATHSNLTASTGAPAVSNNSGTVTWAIASGTSPTGMTFSAATGVLTAVNVAAGSYPYTLTATDAAGGTATTGTFTVSVTAPIAASTPANLRTHANLTASAAAPTVTNGVGATTWAIASGTLPTGMTLNAATGVLTATNVATGAYAYTLAVADAAGGTATTGSFTVTVSPALSTTTPANLSTHANLTASTAAPTITNGVGTTTWSLATGTLPSGMTLNASTGVLTAADVAAGSYAYTLTVADQAGGTATTGSFAVTVSPVLAVSTPANLSTHSNLTASTGAPTVTGNSGAVAWTLSTGTLPTGMTLNASSGALTATNVPAGSYAYTLTATDAAGGSASTGSFTVTVAAPLATTTPANLATHSNLTASTVAPTVTNASGAVTWSIASGTLPTGMTLNATSGVLTAAYVAAGSYPFTLTVADAAGGSATSGSFTVVVATAMSVSTPAGVSTHANLTASTAAPVVMSASGAVSWTIASGTLPTGMSLDAGTGKLTATNVAAGTYPFVLAASDAAGGSASTNQFTLTVVPALATSTPANLATHSNLTASTAAPAASNGVGTVSWTLASGTLPTGMTFASGTGVLTAANVAAGTYAYALTATDAAGGAATTGSFTITVSPALAATTPANLSTHSNLTASTAAPTTANAVGAVTWSVASGTLPTGMTFAPVTGVLTATSVAPGTYAYTLNATDAAGGTATTGQFTVTVTAAMAAGAPASLSTHSNLTASTAAPSVTNNSGAVTWTIASGTLPTGMAFAPATGVLTATSVAAGSYAYTLTATDPAGGTATTGSFTVAVSPALGTSTPANLATHANLTASTTAPIVTNGVGTITWTIASGTLPTGMGLNASTGALTATNVAAGSYPYALTATDSAGGTATTGSFSVTVAAAMTATAPANLSTHANLTASTATPTTANATGTVAWTVASGTLPAGMSFNASTGALTATNVAAGSYAYTLTAADQAGGTATTGSFTITVAGALSATAQANLSTHANLTSSTANPTTANATGAVAWTLSTGTLPTGMTLNASTGALTAANVAAGTYAYTLKATDATGASATTGSLTVTVAGAMAASTPANLSTHANLTASTATPTTSNATGAVTWSITTGSLPSGMSFAASTGVLTATNVAAGSYAYTLTATDAAGGSATTGSFTVAVAAAMSVSTPSGLSTHANLTASTVAPVVMGGSGTVTWSIASGALPTGMTLNASTGAITAANVAQGTYSYTLAAADAAGGTATTGSIAVTVFPALSVTTPANLSTHANLTASTSAPTASGNSGTVGWAIATGSLPAGMSFSATTGVLTATNVTAGSYAYTLTATDTAGGSATTGSFTVTTSNALAATAPANLSTHSNQTVSSAAPTTTNAVGTVTWSIATGSLPSGMSFAASTGVLTATNVAAGTYAYALTAADASGGTATTGSFSIVVAAPLTAAAPANRSAHSDQTASTAAPTTANGSGAVSWTRASGTLPTGMSLNASTGILTATSVANGTYAYTLTATDAAGATATTGSFTITVTSPMTATTPTAVTGNVGTAVAAPGPTIANAIGTSTVSYAATSGTLPAGLSVSTVDGSVSGTPTATGTATIVETVVDAAGEAVATGGFTVTISAAIPTAQPGPSLSAATVAPTAAIAYSGDLSTIMSATNLRSPTWTATGLPNGLSLSTAGILSGSATAAGTATATIKVTDSDQTYATQTLTIQVGQNMSTAFPISTMSVGAGALASSTSTEGTSSYLANGYDNSGDTVFPAEYLYASTGGNYVAGVRYTYASPMSYDGTYSAVATTVFGAPTYYVYYNTGTYSSPLWQQFTSGSAPVTATDFELMVVIPASYASGSSMSGARLGYGGVVPAYLQSISAAVAHPIVGVAYSTTLDQLTSPQNVSGTETWSIVSGTVPTGFSITSSGKLTGTGNTIGDYPLTVAMTDGRGVTTPPTSLTISVQSAVTTGMLYPIKAVRVGVGASDPTYAVNYADYVASGYDGSSTTTYPAVTSSNSAGSSSTDAGIQYSFAQPVSFDGTHKFTFGSSGTAVELVYYNKGSASSPVWTGWTQSSGTVTSTDFQFIEYSGVASSGITSGVLGYGGNYLATVPSITANTITATQGGSYSGTLDTIMGITNNSGTETWTTTASMPAGLTLNASGTVTGTATTPGTYAVPLQVSDGKGVPSYPAVLTIQVNAPSNTGVTYPATGTPIGYGTGLSASTTTVDVFYDNDTYSYPQYVDGYSSTSWGVIYNFSAPVNWDGTATVSSTTGSSMTVKYYYNTGTTASPIWTQYTSGVVTSTDFKITASGQNVLGTAMLGYGGKYPAYLPHQTTGTLALTSGTAYSGTLDAIMKPTYVQGTETWSVPYTSPSLPPGITISAAGVISGTPTTSGTYYVKTIVSDTRGYPSLGGQSIGEGNLTITVK